MAILDEFKLRNIFGGEPNYRTPPFIPPHSIPQQRVPPLPMDAQQPEDPYQQHINAMPVRENPSMLRKILAAAASGFANMRTPQNAYGMTESILQAPYMQKLEDWKLKEGTLRNQALMQDREEKLRLQETNIERQRERDAANNEVAQLRAQVQAEGLEHKKRIEDLTKSEQLLKQAEARLAEIEARAAGQERVEGVRQTGREAIEDKRQAGRMEVTKERGEQARSTRSTVPGGVKKPGAATKEETPTQRRIRIFNNAQQAKIARPDWAPHITVDKPGNKIEVKPAATGGWFSRGPTPEMRAEIIRAIYPDGVEEKLDADTGPKVGDTKTFPNGKTGKWDGKGWVAQ